MKNKPKKLFEAGVAIAVALSIVLSGVTVIADKEIANGGVMIVQDTSAMAGATGHVISIDGSWNATLGGYSIALRFDASMITISDISLEGTVAEEYDWNLYWSVYRQNDSYLVAAALTLIGPMIPAGSGSLFKLIVDVAEDATGETILDLDQHVGPTDSRSIYVDEFGVAIYPELIDGVLTIESILCGDANGDDVVDLGDVVFLLNYLFRGGQAPELLCRADANGDASIDLADIVYLTNYLFRGGDPPVDDCCA